MDEDLLEIDKGQGWVSLNGSELASARDFESTKSDPLIVLPSGEFSDGNGGISGEPGILRIGQGRVSLCSSGSTLN